MGRLTEESRFKQCKQSLPEGCTLNALRIDAAGYQSKKPNL